MQGRISLGDTLHKCSHVIEETFSKVDITTEQSDGVKRSNKMTKEFQKFLAAFEVVEALPAEYDKLKEDMEISISSYIYKPVKFYDKWIEEASEKASTKGHTVLFNEKILPALAPNKSFRNNSAEFNAAIEEARKLFKEHWSKITVDTEADDARRAKILEIVKPMVNSDPTKAVIDVAEVKTLVGEAKICWSCLSQTCLSRQIISRKYLKGKKLVNRFCTLRRMTLGDKSLEKSLNT